MPLDTLKYSKRLVDGGTKQKTAEMHASALNEAIEEQVHTKDWILFQDDRIRNEITHTITNRITDSEYQIVQRMKNYKEENNQILETLSKEVALFKAQFQSDFNKIQGRLLVPFLCAIAVNILTITGIIALYLRQ